MSRGSSKKLSRSVLAFNKDDSVEFQESRSLKGVVYDLFIRSVGSEITRRAEFHSPDPLKILDVGCGSGPWIEAILKYVVSYPGLPRLHIQGIDPAQRLIDCARRRLCRYSNVELENRAFQNFDSLQKFDVIYFVDVVQHLDRSEHKLLFAKTCELLVPGGTTIIVDKEKYSTYAIKMKLKRSVFRLPDYYYTAEYPSFRSLRRLAINSGLLMNRQFRHNQFGCLVMSKPPLPCPLRR